MSSFYKKWVFRSTTGVMAFMTGVGGILLFAFLLVQDAGLYPLVASALTGIGGTTIGVILYGNALLQRVRYERSKKHSKRSQTTEKVEYAES